MWARTSNSRTRPEFKAFWDADAKRVEDAVRTIGRVEG